MSQLLNRSKGKKKTQDQRSDLSEIPVVYFLVVDGNAIKIGETKNFPKRLSEHRASHLGTRKEVEPLCVVRGVRADEKAICRYFDALAIPGEEEVFRIEPALVDYIRWMRAQHYVWTPDCDMSEIARLDTLESTHWMPTPERKKAPPIQKDLFSDFGPLQLPPQETTVDDFYTNPRIIEAARSVFGGRIDLDPASHTVANRNVKATTFYTLYDDGTTKEWCGNVWLNPPFSEWQKWVPKIVSEWASGRITQMCVLVATRTITAQYFAEIHYRCTSVCIFRGRIPFWGGLAGTPDDGHAVFYFGNDPKTFAKYFSILGYVYRPEKNDEESSS